MTAATERKESRDKTCSLCVFSRPIRYCFGVLLLAGFIAAMVWAKARDPFVRMEFTLKTASGGNVNGMAILPKPVGKHAVVIYLQGAGGSLLGSGSELRQVAELGLAAVGLEYCQTNQAVFDEQFIALYEYLQKQPWAQSNATAWVGFSLGAQRTLSFALRPPEYQPQLLVRRAGGWVEEINEKFKIQNEKIKPLTPAVEELEKLKVEGSKLKVEVSPLTPIKAERESGRTGEGIRPSTFNSQPSTSIRCPVLLIHGERDEVFPVADCRRLAEYCAGKFIFKNN